MEVNLTLLAIERTEQTHVDFGLGRSSVFNPLYSFTATDETPHGRMLGHPRRYMNGSSTPSWQTTPRKVLLRRHVRTSKQDLLVDEVDLIHLNPLYGLVRFPDVREDTFSTRELTPTP